MVGWPGNVSNAGTSLPSKPGPSFRMWSGVPSAARDVCWSSASWPSRCWPLKVLFGSVLTVPGAPGAAPCRSWAPRDAEPVPWKTLFTKAGPPPIAAACLVGPEHVLDALGERLTAAAGRVLGGRLVELVQVVDHVREVR